MFSVGRYAVRPFKNANGDSESAAFSLVLHALTAWNGQSPAKEKNKWIRTNQLLPVVKGLLLPGGCLHEKTYAERKRIVVAYLKAFADTFPEAWSDEKRASYSLLQASSLQITIGLLPDVMQRCDFYEGFSYTYATLKEQLEPLAEIALLNQWKKSAVDEALSTKPKREMFLGQLREALKVKPPSS